jgi:regulator of nucleoside diphosphate kinase
MNTPNIQITQSDFNKLQDLLRSLPKARPEEKGSREALSRELLRAEIKPSHEIPSDVITLNSRARLRDLASDDILELTIVLPDEVDVENGRISILAPLGTAMLGYRAGDIFEWKVPGGHSRFQVEEILFQPESAEQSAE